MYNVELIAGDIIIGNFSSYVINTSIYQLANTAIFSATDKDFEALLEVKQRVNGNLKAQVKIDGAVVISGYISEPKAGYGDKKPVLDIKINSFASRLVGANVNQGKNYKKLTAFAIISDLVSGFDIKVINLSANNDIIPSFITSGLEHIDLVINRLAKISNVLVYSDAMGRLVLTDKNQNKKTTSALITGKNIINIKKNINVHSLYAEVKLYSQKPMEDDLSIDEIINSSIRGKSKGVARTYHKITNFLTKSHLENVISDLEEEAFDCQVISASFKDTGDKILAVNEPIIVKDQKWLDLDDTFLITELNLQKSSDSYQAVMNLEEMG